MGWLSCLPVRCVWIVDEKTATRASRPAAWRPAAVTRDRATCRRRRPPRSGPGRPGTSSGSSSGTASDAGVVHPGRRDDSLHRRRRVSATLLPSSLSPFSLSTCKPHSPRDVVKTFFDAESGAETELPRPRQWKPGTRQGETEAATPRPRQGRWRMRPENRNTRKS